MAIYQYKGLDKLGKDVKGVINAEGEPQAKNRLKNQGIMIIEIAGRESKEKKSSNLLFSKPISIQDLSLMTRQLATLIKAKIQIVEAFKALVDQTENPKLRVILAEVKSKVNEGTSIAKSLAEHPKVFNNVYINMVEAGEASGTLHIVLNRLAEFTESQMKLKNKIKSALTYPMIMMIVGLAVTSVIFIFVIPQITKILITMKKELPPLTKIAIAISNFLIGYWWLIIIASILGYILLKKYFQTEKGKRKLDTILLKSPIIGNLIIMINVSRFCSTLGTLLNSGVPILASMRIVSNLISNAPMKESVEESRVAIAEGASMTGPLVKSEYFPTMVTHMLKLGEQSGEVEEMLAIISETYEDQVNNKLNGLTSIIEPIMMVVLGLIVGLVVFSVVLPMMDMNQIN